MKIIVNGKEIDVNVDDLKKALEENKTTYEIKVDALVVRSQDDEKQFVDNIKKEHERVGLEIGVKQMKEKFGLEFDGKSMETLVEAAQKKALADAKIEPEGKLKEALKNIETLKQTVTTKEQEVNEIKTQFDQYKNQSTIKTVISSALPEKLAIPKDDFMTILQNKYQFDVVDGSVVVKENGEIKKDDLLNPVKPSVVIEQFISNNPVYLGTPAGGSGGKDSTEPGAKKSLEKFISEMATKGIAPNSAEFNKALDEEIKAGNVEM